MTNTSKTIIFFGTDDFSAVTLRELIEKGFTIGAVVTKPDSQKGRGRNLQKPITKEIAEEHGIAVWQPVKVNEITENIQQLTTELGEKPVGILVSYGKIIPQSVIDLFAPGIINVHPSLLPKYRGPSPVETAVLNGDTETGVTIMQLSAAMDAGPIYSQVTVQLNDTETGPQLREQLAALGAQEISVLLPRIVSGALAATPQDDASATYCRLFTKDDATLAPTAYSAEQAERHVRAHLGFPKTKATIAGHQVIITEAHVTSPADDFTPTPLDVLSADGHYLAIDELISPSGKKMPSQAFLNGYLRG